MTAIGELSRLIQELRTEVDALKRKPPVQETQTVNFMAREGQTLTVEAPAAGISGTLVQATAYNRGARITFVHRSPNRVTYRAVNGLVNGLPFVVVNAPGTFEAISDGSRGWSLGQGVGQNGVPGAPGTPGTIGPAGPPGSDGERGADGDPGPPGRDGANGLQGPPGVDGAPGEQGDSGPPGRDGTNGVDGAPGAAGPPGPPGTDGQDGQDGMPGPPGAAGATGQQGSAGQIYPWMDPPEQPADMPIYIQQGGSSATPSWAQTLAVAAASGANNPSIDGGQQIRFAGGAATGDIRSTGGLDVQVVGGNFNLACTFAAADITVNTVGGIAIQAGATPITSVTGNDIFVACDGDVRIGGLSGVSIAAGAASAGPADVGDIVFNPSGGLGLFAGALTGTGVSDTDICLNTDGGVAITAHTAVNTNAPAGDIVMNAQSGISINALATQNTTGAAAGDVIINADGGVFLGAGNATPSTDANNLDISLVANGAVAVDAGFTAGTNPAAGDIAMNATSGIVLKAGATQQSGAAGIEIVSDTTIIETAGTTQDISLRAARILVSDSAGTGRGQVNLVESASAGTVNAGQGGIWVENLTPNRLIFADDSSSAGQWPLNVHGMSSQVSTPATFTVNALTTQITPVNSSMPAGTMRVGSTWEWTLMGTVTRGATATAFNLQADLLINGVSVRTLSLSISPTGSTYGWTIMGMLNILSIGAAGTFSANMQGICQGGGNALTTSSIINALEQTRSVAATAIDTTINRAIAVRVQMSAAVAATQLVVCNAVLQRTV